MDYWRDLIEFVIYLLNITRWQFVDIYSRTNSLNYSGNLVLSTTSSSFHIQRRQLQTDTGQRLVQRPPRRKVRSLSTKDWLWFEAIRQRWTGVFQGSATRALWQRSHKGGTQPSLWVSSYWKDKWTVIYTVYKYTVSNSILYHTCKYQIIINNIYTKLS